MYNKNPVPGVDVNYIPGYIVVFSVLRTMIELYSPNPPKETPVMDILYFNPNATKFDEYFAEDRLCYPVPGALSHLNAPNDGNGNMSGYKSNMLNDVARWIVCNYFSFTESRLNPRMRGWGTLLLPLAAIMDNEKPDLTFPYESMTLDEQQLAGSKNAYKVGHIYPDVNLESFGYVLAGNGINEARISSSAVISVVKITMSIRLNNTTQDEMREFIERLRTKINVTTDRCYAVSYINDCLNLPAWKFKELLLQSLCDIKVLEHHSLKGLKTRAYLTNS